MMNLAMIGCGYWGKNIARNLHEMGVLSAVCDSDPRIRRAIKETYPSVFVTADFNEILSSEHVRGVIISTPAVTHYDLAVQAILSGKDVLVEKPLALTMKEGCVLRDLAQKEGRVLMVGHILQYHPAVEKLKELIQEGRLGKLEYIYSNRLNIGKLRTEENILWSFAPHDVSVVLSLVDDEVTDVSASGGCYLSAGVYDTTMTTLGFKSGVKGHIFVSWLHPYKEQKLVVVGSKAMAVFDDMAKEKLLIYEHKIEWTNGRIPVAQKAGHKAVVIKDAEPLKAELAHFVECIKDRKNPKTDADEALGVLDVLEKAESYLAKKGRRLDASDSLHYFVHETAIVDSDVMIGGGAKIWHFSHVLKNCRIGKNAVIGQNVSVGPDVMIGDNVKVQNNVSIYKGVILEDDVFCGPSCVFTNVYTPRAFIERKNEFRDTVVKKGATIGANATIVCGATIGRYALVGAGAVVKGDVPDYAVVVGVPAKQKGWACKCGVPLKFNEKKRALCARCKSEYKVADRKFVVVKELV